MNSFQFTQELSGKWYGGYGRAPCPVCQPERRRDQNALSVSDGRDGRLLAHCKKSHCSFADILTAAGVTLGTFASPDPATIAQRKREERVQAEKKAQYAERCWKESQPIRGTIAEEYLRGRGITCDLPEVLRFHPEAWHRPTARRYRALIARVDGAQAFAVHRTYLRQDGTGKAAVEPAKAMLGSVAGGAVRLTEARGPLVVAEGIETALSLASGLLSGPATIWAALSTSGLRGLHLPQLPGRLTIATDGDPAGAEAGLDLAERAHATGWAVSMLPAPSGLDWNDILLEKAVAA